MTPDQVSLPAQNNEIKADALMNIFCDRKRDLNRGLAKLNEAQRNSQAEWGSSECGSSEHEMRN